MLPDRIEEMTLVGRKRTSGQDQKKLNVNEMFNRLLLCKMVSQALNGKEYSTEARTLLDDAGLNTTEKTTYTKIAKNLSPHYEINQLKLLPWKVLMHISNVPSEYLGWSYEILELILDGQKADPSPYALNATVEEVYALNRIMRGTNNVADLKATEEYRYYHELYLRMKSHYKEVLSDAEQEFLAEIDAKKAAAEEAATQESTAIYTQWEELPVEEEPSTNHEAQIEEESPAEPQVEAEPTVKPVQEEVAQTVVFSPNVELQQVIDALNQTVTGLQQRVTGLELKLERQLVPISPTDPVRMLDDLRIIYDYVTGGIRSLHNNIRDQEAIATHLEGLISQLGKVVDKINDNNNGE